jgi:hypothetical protein
MDQRLRYEQLISEKLESLPIPDMADAIWARIEAQLDIDLPTDEGGGTTPDAPSGPGMMGWGLSVVIIALITAFLINKNKPDLKDSNTKLPATQNEQTTPALAPGTGPPPPDNSRTFSNRPRNKVLLTRKHRPIQRIGRALFLPHRQRQTAYWLQLQVWKQQPKQRTPYQV